MKADIVIDDQEFGHIYVRFNVRAVRFTFRAARDGSPQCGLLVTIPSHTQQKDLLRLIEEKRAQLRNLVSPFIYDESDSPSRANAILPINFDFRIDTECLKISIVCGTRPGFYLHNTPARFSKDTHGNATLQSAAEFQIICPPDCDFMAEGRQDWLQKAIIEGIRTHAKAQLIPRLKAYASQYGISVKDVKINNSKSHWGSCSHHKEVTFLKRRHYYNINLSLYTLLLPLSLQKLILLHELMHTRYMDHSDAFHHELDQWLDGQEEALEQQLKQFTTSIFSFIDRKSPRQ